MLVRRTVMAALPLAAVTVLAGCAGQNAPAPAAAPASARPAAASLTITDPWVKAAEKGMTAAFGTLVNDTDAPITVVSGTSPAAGRIELHEVVDSDGSMVMRPKQGGFVVPPRGTHQLQPGGDHIMLMDLPKAVRPGDEVQVTLTLQGGGTFRFTAVGKDFAGAREDYHPGHGDKE
ncbi:hypothetical protein HNP84_000320 [Thermocatellispora tengchongensis]|uniref:Copper chaperone PCu(A)C n=1 Tax=Thermocatellispora tengchongensis TaxID=1073253 RepID=A0A840NTP9_9ACTN|nr:copper chaperone PCu(A)C [Thermocatellispora tengchongensis]MBB5130632.1 hypothetical protein [Thermocatellispora tengchongensis]